MKNAVCLSGQPRIIDDICENHRIALSNFDFHIHGWWHDDHRRKTKLFHSTEKFDDCDMSKIYVDRYNPKSYFFEDYREFDITFCKSHDYKTWTGCTQKHYDIFTPSLLYGLLSQSQSVKESVYLALKNENYKWIARTRPDVLYSKDLKLIFSQIEPKEDVIYFQSSMNGGHAYSGEFPNNPCDWFFAGSPKVMKKFVDAWHDVLKDYCSTGIKHVRDIMKKVAEHCSLKIELVDFGVLVYRQLINYTKKRDINLYYQEFDSETLSITKNQEEWPHWHTKIDFKFLRRSS